VTTFVDPAGAAAGCAFGQLAGMPAPVIEPPGDVEAGAALGTDEPAGFPPAPNESELGLAPPPKLIAPLARATPIAKTTTAPIAHHAVGMPLAALPPRVAPAWARWVCDRFAPGAGLPPDWTARRFFDERGRGRFGSELKRLPPGRR
jgi:hypothetical protein